MIPRLQTEQELEDPYAADEEYLREVIAQASAPSPAPVAAPAAVAPSTPFDVFKQNLFTTQYSPTGASPETGADQFQAGAYGYQLGNQWVSPDDQGGYVVNTPTAKEGIYKAERFDASGNKLSEFINDARNTDLQDLAQLATFALGVGPLGGMLGSTVAGALGIPVATATSAGLTAAQLAALGTTVGSAGLGILQDQDPLDVLQNAIKAGATAFLPSQVSSFIPSTGTAALDAALKTATEAGVRTAVNGGDVESAVIGSLVNSGVGAATGAAGLPPALVNTAIGIAKSGGDPQKIFNAVVSAGPAIQGLQNYYSKTDTGDETARLQARYGTADDALFKQIEAMAPRDTSVPPTQADVEESIFQDVVRQSPEQQLAPASTESVERAIDEDVRRMSVYDASSAKDLQSAGAQAQAAGYNTFTFGGGEYTVGTPVPTTEDVRRASLPDYSSSRTVNAAGEAARTRGQSEFVYNGQVYRVTAPVQVTAAAGSGRGLSPGMTAAEAAKLDAGAGRGISPGATAADAVALSRIPLAGQSSAPFVNPAVDFTEAATASQGNPLSADYKPSTTPSDIVQNLRDVRQNIKQSTDTGGRLGFSQATGTVARLAEIIGSGFGTAPQDFVTATGEVDPLTAMQGEPLSSDAAVRDVQKELYDYQKSQLAALPNDAQRAFASGVASTVNTALTYPIGGPLLTVANAAANTGNLAWMQGKEAKLSDEDNAKRALFMAGIEGAGEALGIPFLKMLFKEAPMTGSKDALTNWLATKLKALGGENFTEQLTTAGQFAVDRVADFGIPSQATDLTEALKQTGISTFASFGGNAAIGSFYGTPGLQTVTTQAPPTPIEFLGSTPATQIVPTEGVPQQLTYQAPAAPPSPVQITGPEAAAPAPEIFGPEAQLGFEEGVRPTAQQQLEEALSGVYEPPAPPAPAPSVPSDTTGITPEMVAFIDEDGGIVTYGDLGFTAPSPAPSTAPATQPATQTQPATDAIFAEPQMDEINRLFQEVYQQQNYPVAVPATAPTAAPTTALTAAPAQQDVIDLAPALTTAAPAQDLSAYQQALNQAVYGGTGEEPSTQAPAPSAPATGTILSTDPTQGTALVVGPNGDTKVVDVSPDSKPGDTVNINAPSQDLSTPVATDPTTGEVIRLGDVTPSAPAPSTTETKTQAPAPSQAVVTTAAPSPAPSTTETKTEAPAPAAPSPAPAPTTTETKTQAPAPAPTTTEIKTEAPAPAPTITETKTEAPAPAPTTTETKTEAPAPAPSTTETRTEAPAPAPSTTETKAEAPAPSPAPAPAEVTTAAPAPAPAPAPTTQAPTPAPPPSQPPAQPPAQPPSQPPAQPPAKPPAPAPTPAPTPPPPGEDVLPPVTEEELREIVSGPPPAPTPPAPTPAPPAPTPAPPAPTPAPPAPTPPAPTPPAPTPAPPAPTVKPPVLKPPSPAPSPAAQLAQVPGMTPELANLVQELMRTDPANLLAFTMVLQEEQEEKREGLRGKLKSRKA